MAYAQPQVSPQGIVVNPTPTDLQVRTWVNKDPGKTGNPTYQVDEGISISVQTNQDAFVYLFSVKSNGEIDAILPNVFDQDNIVRAGQTRTFPPAGARYAFNVSGPEGQDRVLAVASKQRLNVQDIVDIQSGRVKIRGADNLGRLLSIIVTPLPQRDWISDVAFFAVGRVVVTPPPPPPPVATTGTLAVASNPQGAQVLVNGRGVGNTPVNITLQPGQYNLELRQSGYEVFRQSVSVAAGQTVNVTANLAQQAVNGLLSIASNPQGGQVLINGRVVGNTPTNVSVQPGQYNIEIRLSGYDVFRTSVSVSNGQTVNINAPLVAERRVGELLVASVPAGADVFINGTRVGVTPLRVTLNEGNYDVRVATGGYTEFRGAVQVQRNQSARVDAQLAPLTVALQVVTNTDARVFVDGTEVGQTRNGVLQINVRPGSHQVVVIAPGYRVAFQDVRAVQNGQVVQVPMIRQ
jgi:hypothetical protein